MKAKDFLKKFNEEDTSSELEQGKKIEVEHKSTILTIIQMVKDGKSDDEILQKGYEGIALNHLDGSNGEAGIKDYYTRLIKMEKEAKQ